MKCDCIIQWGTRRAKGSGEPKRVVLTNKTITWWALTGRGPFTHHGTEEEFLSQPDREICGGNIIATVRAVDEPYMGGHSAELQIEYKCDKCENTFHPHLPSDSEGLSAWLTNALATMDGRALQEAYLAKHNEEEARRDQMLSEFRARRGASKRSS